MKDKRRAFPVPELVAPHTGTWTVEDVPFGGHTSRETRHFTAPHDSSPHARAVQLHELSHLRWSPSKPDPLKYGVDPNSLLACEDARVNTLINRHVEGAADWFPEAMSMKPADCPLAPAPERVAAMTTLGMHKQAALLTIACAGTSQYTECIMQLLFSKRRAVVQAYNRLADSTNRDGFIPFSATVDLARAMDELFAVRMPANAAGGGLKDREKKPARGPRIMNLVGRWSPMKVLQPARPVATIPPNGARWIVRDSGAIVRRADRLFHDRMIFGEKRVRKAPGGTVILDGSGSMSWDNNDIERLLAQAPAATVALYNENGPQAYLTVLAKDGRRVRNLDCLPYGSGNGCDAAALDWGRRFAEPRIWISDGAVCSDTGGMTHAMEEDVRRVCRAGRYQRVVRTSEALAALAGKPVQRRGFCEDDDPE